MLPTTCCEPEGLFSNQNSREPELVPPGQAVHMLRNKAHAISLGENNAGNREMFPFPGIRKELIPVSIQMDLGCLELCQGFRHLMVQN